MEGLLSESTCKQVRPLKIRTEPIAQHYDVEARPFARGKFATVRRCRHIASGVEFAAKCMRKRRRAADVRHEILHEAHVLELAEHHPHIVHMHEMFETPSEVVLVLELVSGGEVQRVLDDEETVGEEEAARLLTQILDGLAFLHKHNIAHLDLKPQNLLLTEGFPKGCIKLCDFGISRLITKGIDIREIVGTPDYVAPEILHYEPISLATDMWSVGILTYVLLSGHSPFGGDTKQETFCNITRGRLDFPSDLFPHTSQVAKHFVSRLLLRDPKERMTAEECLSHPWLSPTSMDAQTLGIELTLTPEHDSSSDSESVLNSPSPSSTNRDLKNGHDSTSDLLLQETVSSYNNNIQSTTFPKGCDYVANGHPKSEVSPSNSQRNSLNGKSDHNLNIIFSKSTNGSSDLRSTIFTSERKVYTSKTLKEHNTGVLCTSTNNAFSKSTLSEQKMCVSKSANGTMELNENSAVKNGIGDQKSGTGPHNVDMMVSQFEELSSMSKRIVFSEEIIVDERMGIVY